LEVKIMEKRGIDVSKWQGVIDWKEVKDVEVEFAILREGYGKKSPTQIDKQFKTNYEGAKAVGIPVGVYHYSYADSVSDAKLEAEFCLENIRGMQLEYPVCFDIEDKEQLKLNNRQRTDIVKAFCEEIEKAGYYAMFYCNLNWLNNYLLKTDLISKYDLWLAQWNAEKPAVSCGIWQNKETGIVSGISGHTDINV
jgi:GH25 family lysozyme M1 (1,4-beta-N-acetylmuramidase)